MNVLSAKRALFIIGHVGKPESISYDVIYTLKDVEKLVGVVIFKKMFKMQYSLQSQKKTCGFRLKISVWMSVRRETKFSDIFKALRAHRPVALCHPPKAFKLGPSLLQAPCAADAKRWAVMKQMLEMHLMSTGL